MKRALILHGTMGSRDGNWFAWLDEELAKRGIETWRPALPGAKQPSLREWLGFVHNNVPFQLDDDTAIIGHSSGAILALLLSQESSRPIGSVVCVSVFHDNSLKWEANNRLFDVPFDFDAIKKLTRKFLFVHSDTDPYVPLKQAQYVADNCAGEMVVIPGQGHFNLEQSPDYVQFPKLLELLNIRQMI